MKDAYIIFRNQYPQTRREVLALIKEFCQKHDLHYSKPANTDSLTVNIEGEYIPWMSTKKKKSQAVYTGSYIVCGKSICTCSEIFWSLFTRKVDQDTHTRITVFSRSSLNGYFYI